MTKDLEADTLQHYGVLGMKWGVRRKASGQEIVTARKALKAKSSAYRKDYKKLNNYAEGSPARKKLERSLQKQHQDYLKDPDRAIASRMTRGEKAATLLTAGSGVGGAVSVSAIVGTSLASRRIEYKQDKGAYNKMSKGGKPKSHLGFQRQRSALVVGATIGPMVVKSFGPAVLGKVNHKVATKAAANRMGARKAATRGISSTASKVNVLKPVRGVYKVTKL